ncbi:MAG: DUF4352 domain-containing protein [Clostridia bacterium]|nr:DUF4352 domain-containing protein [Clostridia bacterium]
MKKRVFRIMAVMLTAALILATPVALSACSGKNGAKRYSAGDETTLGNWKIKPASVEFSNSLGIGNNLSTTTDEGTLYGIVKLTVTNTGEEDDFFAGMLEIEGELVIRLICDGEQYKASLTLNTEDDLISYKIAPGETKDGFLAFLVPSKAADAGEILLKISLGDKTVEYNLGK